MLSSNFKHISNRNDVPKKREVSNLNKPIINSNIKSKSGISQSRVNNSKRKIDTPCKDSDKSYKQSSNSNLCSKKNTSFAKDVASSFRNIIQTRRWARIILIVLVAFVVINTIDECVNYGKIYQGVHVGDIDLSGKTRAEAQSLIESGYEQNLKLSFVVIYKDSESSSQEGLNDETRRTLAEQLSVDEYKQNVRSWKITYESVGAYLPSDILADRALDIGRRDGWIFTRTFSRLFSFNIQPKLAYNDTALEELTAEIDSIAGDPRIDYNVAIDNGHAYVVDGHDGYMLDREKLKDDLSSKLLSNSDDHTIIAKPVYTKIRITKDDAQKICDQINQAISHGVTFSYKSNNWQVDSSVLGDWLYADIEFVDNKWKLIPKINANAARKNILNSIREFGEFQNIKETMSVNNGEVSVHTNASGDIPLVDDSISILTSYLLGKQKRDNDDIEIKIESTTVPDSMLLDDAIRYGVVEEIKSYTTEYASGSEVDARNTNIHLCADLINNSVCKANGGIWSFNDTAGNCNEERGFKAAGQIQDGVYVDSIGGGICQVATTVFNTVYESGLDVTQRSNHSLYISSYPVGRDAAVDWPNLDFKWQNNTSSDILLTTSYTNSTITVTLYGIDPEYSVETQIGEWKEGEKYITKYIVYDYLDGNDKILRSTGADGRSITITRIIRDKNGAEKSRDVFASVYDPKPEIMVIGPGEFEQQVRNKNLVIDDPNVR